jgi:uncharacterized protein
MMLLDFRIQQSATFLAMSLYGYATRSDLSKSRRVPVLGLIGIIIASLLAQPPL